AVADEVRKFASLHSFSTHVDVLCLPNLGDTDNVMRAVTSHSLSWTNIVAPYEYAVLNAALFAEKWSGGVRPLGFHPPLAARLSRDKRHFREFIQELGDPIVVPIPHKVLAVREVDLD